MDINTAYSEKDGEKVVAPRRWKVDARHTDIYKWCLDSNVEKLWVFADRKTKIVEVSMFLVDPPKVYFEELSEAIALYEIKKI